MAQLVSVPISKINYPLSKIEESILKAERKDNVLGNAVKDLAFTLQPRNNSRNLLSKEEQVDLSKLEAQHQHLKFEEAQLDVQHSKQTLALEFANSKGQFIAQLMKDNNWLLEKAKEVAAEVFVMPEIW